MQLLECFWSNVTATSERGTQRSEENKGIQLDLILVPGAAQWSRMLGASDLEVKPCFHLLIL